MGISVPLGPPRIMVMGFCFTEDHSEVVLVSKNRPEWMRGRLNGVGGGVEAGESAVSAMVREFQEETGVVTGTEEWVHFLTLQGRQHPWQVKVFRAFAGGVVPAVRTTTDENVVVLPVDTLRLYPVVPNLRWMIPLALDGSLAVPALLEETP